MPSRTNNLNKPIKRRHVKSVSTTAIATPLTRDPAATEFTFSSPDTQVFVRFDNATVVGSVAACTSADGGNWHGYCVTAGSPLTLEMPTDCNFISVVALGSGTMYAYQS